MWKKIRLYISPLFLQRFLLSRKLIELIRQYRFSGQVLDVGCGSKPYRQLFKYSSKYLGIDFPNYSLNKDSSFSPPDYFFTSEYSQNYRLPFAANQFAHTVSFQVLEHHPQPQKLLSEMARITKKGGYILLTFPFIGGLHEEPHDYQRLTHYQIQRWAKDNHLKVTAVHRLGSLAGVISVLLNEQLGYFASGGKWQYVLSVPVHFFLLAGQYLALLADLLWRSKTIFINYVMVLQK